MAPQRNLTFVERWFGSTKQIVAVVIGVLLIAGWTTDTFDNFLWRVHLNHSTCIENGFGAVFCGDAAKNYQDRLRNLGLPTKP